MKAPTQWYQKEPQRLTEEYRNLKQHPVLQDRWDIFGFMSRKSKKVIGDIWLMGIAEAYNPTSGKRWRQRPFLVRIPEHYPRREEKLGRPPAAYPFGWHVTQEGCDGHLWPDGSACYGDTQTNDRLTEDDISFVEIAKCLNAWVAGYWQFDLRGVWTHGKHG